MDRLMAKWGGGEVLRRAVSGMLPKNRLRDKRLARLKGQSLNRSSLRRARTHVARLVFEGVEHPYQANLVHTFEPPRIAERPDVKAAIASTSSPQST